MSDHLSTAILNALADGELSADQLASATEHLAVCPSCTSGALVHTMLKSATAKAGQRYSPSAHLQERVTRYAQHQTTREKSRFRSSGWALGWAAAVALLLVSVSISLVQRHAHQTAVISSEYVALTTEVCDQHIATLAANLPPQVLSSDRHTVKPWFQGKIPFSFNLPADLPDDVVLDGANLTYLRNQPSAQLLYSIGKHRVSVFVQERIGATSSTGLLTEHLGFHVAEFTTKDLDVVAVSDVDPARLSDLVSRIERSQADSQKPHD